MQALKTVSVSATNSADNYYAGHIDLDTPPAGSVYEVQSVEYALANTMDDLGQQNLPVLTSFAGFSVTGLSGISGANLSSLWQEGVYGYTPMGIFTANGSRDLSSDGNFSFNSRGSEIHWHQMIPPSDVTASSITIGGLEVWVLMEPALHITVSFDVLFRVQYRQRKAKPGEVERLLLLCSCP